MGKKFLSLFMAACLLCTMLPAEALASDGTEGGPCSHHAVHTADCGYRSPEEAVPCGHICDETCYHEETACLHSEHEETCGGMEDETLCTHVCSEENGCVIQSQNCQHTHDETCGYAEGSEGTPCIFVCQDCTDAEAEKEPEEPARRIPGAKAAARKAAPALMAADVPAPAAEVSNIVYLSAGPLWSASLYDYAVWAWGSSSGMGDRFFLPAGEADSSGCIPFDIGDNPNLLFAAFHKDGGIDWNNKYAQTVDLSYSSETPYFTLAAQTDSEGKFSGTWEATVCNHTWSDQITRDPSCSLTGIRTYTCSACGTSYEESIPKLAHTWNENNVCAVCGSARPMIYIAWEQMYLDDAVIQRYDPYLWVTVQDGSGRWVGAEATCEFAGHSAFALEESDTRFQLALMPEGAEPSWENCALKDTKSVSCPTGAERHYVLSLYYEEWSTVIVVGPYAACEHQWEIVEKTPVTCTQEGAFLCTCGTCEFELYYKRRTPATGHSKAPENLTVVTPATCTAEGSGTYICENCQETVSVSIPATGHQYVHAYDNPPTCTADGVKINRCEVCQVEAQGEAIPATGHSVVPEDPEKLTVVTAPDCYTDGESTYICENCQQTVSVTVPATGHDFQPGEVIESPGCTTTGGQIYHCANPGCPEQTGRDLPALGHDFGEDLICKRCSQEATILLTAADGSTAHYISMTDALLDANDTPGGATIQLLKDTTWQETRSDWGSILGYAQGPVVLDLNDCTLTYENLNTNAYDYYNSELTVKNGSLYVEYGTRIFGLDNCHFTMENVTVATHLGFEHLVHSVGSQSRITMTNVVLECNAGWSALHLAGGTAELTDCIFYTGTEASSDNNAIRVVSNATLRISGGRYKRIICTVGDTSVSKYIDSTTHCYRYIDGNYIAPTDAADMTDIVNVDVVPKPFKVVGSTELLEAPVGRPVTITPGYTANAEDFDPTQLTFQWRVQGNDPQFTQNEDGSITITPSEAGTVTAYCDYLYRGYQAAKSVNITVTACQEHSYDSQGLCRYCKAYQPAEDTDADGCLEITNPGNLWWFSQQVNDGNARLSAVLTANIDLSTTCGEGIGNWQPIGNKYAGHFNGQGFTISNLYMSGDDQYIGLFGYVKGATIENVSVTGIVSSTFSSFIDLDNYVYLDGAAGGIVAYMRNGTISNCHVDMTVSGGYSIGGTCGTMDDGRIEGCTVNGNVICNTLPDQGSGFYIGGIVGCQYGGTVRGCVNRANASAENSVYFGGIAGLNASAIENCLNYGTFHCTDTRGATAGGIVGINDGVIRGCGNLGSINISGTGEWIGGIAGFHQKSSDGGIIENCYNVGGITSGDGKYGFIVGVLGTDAIATNCYYLSDTTTEDGGRTAEQFASGQVTYELNGSTTADTNVWRQTIGTDDYPTFSGSLVYYGEIFRCDGTSLGESYSNSVPGAIPDHSYGDNGLCTVCRHSNTPAVDSNGDGYYEIDTPAKLWWFSQQVNGGSRSLNAVLTANIDLSATCGEGIGNWQPISHTKGYRGRFDGQNFTISGLFMTGNDQYVGLFGYVGSGTIENVHVTGSVSSTFQEDADINCGAAGGIVACLGKGTIRNCHVDMTVSGEYWVGGICGTMEDDGLIEGCTVRGVVTSPGKEEYLEMDVGGIVGAKWQGIIRDCTNQASISAGAWAYLGGIAGGNYNDSIENCLNQGTVTGRETYYSDTAGGIVGKNMGIIRCCVNQGAVTVDSSRGYAGGIAGTHSQVSSSIESCYNVGTITAGSGTTGSVFGNCDEKATVQNNYYLSASATDDGGRTTEQFASGQVTYELNGSVTAETNIWRQTIGSDAYPVFTGALVYYADTFHCDGSSTGICYHNQVPDTSVPPHQTIRDTGICTVCTQRVGYLRITIGNTDHYAMTLAEAAELAGTETATITLLESMGTAEASADGFGSIACGWLTFDLNGKTLLYDSYPFVSVTAGRLTVTGTGTIRRSANQAVRFHADGGSVRLRGGTYPSGLASSYVQIRDLLDDGYLFKTAAGWQPYDLAAGSFANTVSVSVLPSPAYISQVPNLNSMEITQGETRILSMRAEALDPADTVTYEWIAGDTTITEADFDLSVLPVGTYSLKLTIRCGDVAVYVQYISLTVKHCAHTDMPNGFCSFCGSFAPAELKDGVYQIANGGNLFWFAAMVNGDSTHADFDTQDTGANAVLTADIDLENREWTPIHKYDFASFDGKGHTISGFSMTTTANAADHDYHRKMLGLFGWIDSCSIQNFTLRGSMNITNGGMTGNGRLGTIVGVCDRTSVISGIRSYVSVKIAYEVAYAGGIVGGHYAGAVSQCIAYGDLTSGASFREAGGIAGYVKSGSFDNCGFYGMVANASQHAGGIIGLVDDSGTNVRNCCVSATVSPGGKDTGAIIGHAKANSGTVENNYFDPDWSIENAFGATSGFTFSETAAYAKPVEDFLSGEVAWLLNGSQDNGTWKQTIDGGNHQPNFTELPVYRWEPDEVGGAYTYGNTPKPAGAISVDITWGDLSFTYTKGTWDPSTHTYSGEGWIPDETDGNCITVTNSGELETSLAIRYDAAQGYEAITGTLSEAAAVLPAGEEKMFYLTLAGKPEAEVPDVTIGTITLTIGGE